MKYVFTIGKDLRYWRLLPVLLIIYDGTWRDFIIKFAFLNFFAQVRISFLKR